MDEPSDYIDFIAKYRDWISVKRMGIRPETKPEEVVYHLAGIRTTIDSKAYRLLGINTSVLDTEAARLASGQRKGFQSLGQAISNIEGKESKAALESACGEKRELKPIAEIYLLSKVASELKMDVSINQLIMSKIFPELKPPKAPGRGRKKKQ
ncbi:MAG: DUF2666 family protein [Candidatus Micrarchaeota archaeon]|nr:DUF2666 family protein [Candidatus Micrarchaeota archaeon]